MAVQPIETDIRERAIAWANNSLYGSLGFFLSANGGAPDEHHLDAAIEKLKAAGNRSYHRIAALEAALREIVEHDDGDAGDARAMRNIASVVLTEQQ